jgi:hypothetical protein
MGMARTDSQESRPSTPTSPGRQAARGGVMVWPDSFTVVVVILGGIVVVGILQGISVTVTWLVTKWTKL